MQYSVLIDNLADVLNKEASLYSDFLAISKEKTDVIINGKIIELENITQKESFSSAMHKFEVEREKIIDQIARKSGFNSSELTVSRIVEEHDNLDETLKLKSYRDKIMNLIDELKRVNEINYKLIKNSLEYIDFSINLMTSASDTGSKYGNDGKEGKVERRSIFDVKL